MARSSRRSSRSKRAPAATRVDRPERPSSPYLVIVRAPDGRTRQEQFEDPVAYRMRLATLQSSDTVSIEEIVTLLEN
jgi:hypothetical protein